MKIKIEGNLLQNFKIAAEKNKMSPEEFAEQAVMYLLTIATMDDVDSEIIFSLIKRQGNKLSQKSKDENGHN